jgi:uncharacterized membrane protein
MKCKGIKIIIVLLIIITMGVCFSKKNKKEKRHQIILEESVYEYKTSLPNKLSTIIEEKTIDINITSDKI